jgi:hypothetical protein
VQPNFFDIVKEYNKPKIVALLCGGGHAFTKILDIPGSSKVIESIEIPYGKDALIQLFGEASCSSQMAIRQDDYLFKKYGANYTRIVVNAALSTWPARRGEDRAFIVINGVLKKIDFPKNGEATEAEYIFRRNYQNNFILHQILKVIL